MTIDELDESLAAQPLGAADELSAPPADDRSPQSKSSPADAHKRRFGRTSEQLEAATGD